MLDLMPSGLKIRTMRFAQVLPGSQVAGAALKCAARSARIFDSAHTRIRLCGSARRSMIIFRTTECTDLGASEDKTFPLFTEIQPKVRKNVCHARRPSACPRSGKNPGIGAAGKISEEAVTPVGSRLRGALDLSEKMVALYYLLVRCLYGGNHGRLGRTGR